jgi:hypothetical protein
MLLPIEIGPEVLAAPIKRHYRWRHVELPESGHEEDFLINT